MARGSKRIEALKRSAANARKRAKKSKGNMQEKTGAAAAGAAVGWLEKSGNLANLPTFGTDVPPEIILAGLALLAENYTRPSSMAHNVSKGMATGLIFSTARTYIATGSVSGMPSVAGFMDDGVSGYVVEEAELV